MYTIKGETVAALALLVVVGISFASGWLTASLKQTAKERDESIACCFQEPADILQWPELITH